MPISSAWAQSLQPASYNGVPFVVTGDVYSTGRRVAIHEYPYRDNPLIEDLGLNRRSVEFSGFLVGDSVYSQRDALKSAAEKAGNGTLVHPSLGSITVALVGAGFSERADKGRVVEVRFQFIVVDTKQKWPTTNIATQFATQGIIPDLSSATSGDFFRQIGGALAQGSSALTGAISSVNGFVNTALQPLRDAARLVNSVAGVTGLVGNNFSLGRFCGGASTFSVPVNSVLSGISNTLGTVNRVEFGVARILSNSANLSASVGTAFNRAQNLLGSL